MPDGGTLRMTVRNVSASTDAPVPAGDYVLLEVCDTGVGMDEATKARMFEPFFTTKAVGAGTGLGLATVYGIIKQSGGHIEVQSQTGKGSTFSIHLPRSTQADAETSPVEPQLVDRPAGGRERILIVEDEPGVRAVARRVLARQGYELLEACDGQEAMDILSSNTVDLVLTDMVMPNMGGRELAQLIQERGGAPKIVLMSGYSEEQISRHGDFPTGATLIEKPFTADKLATHIRGVLDGSIKG